MSSLISDERVKTAYYANSATDEDRASLAVLTKGEISKKDSKRVVAIVGAIEEREIKLASELAHDNWDFLKYIGDELTKVAAAIKSGNDNELSIKLLIGHVKNLAGEANEKAWDNRHFADEDLQYRREPRKAESEPEEIPF